MMEGPVIVNFIYYLDWKFGSVSYNFIPDILVKHYSGCFCKDVLDEINI